MCHWEYNSLFISMVYCKIHSGQKILHNSICTYFYSGLEAYLEMWKTLQPVHQLATPFWVDMMWKLFDQLDLGKWGQYRVICWRFFTWVLGSNCTDKIFNTETEICLTLSAELLWDTACFKFPENYFKMIPSNINTLRLRQNGRLFADDTFKHIFLNENIRISLKFVLKGPINNIPALVQIMAWYRSGGRPLSEPMMVILLTHICVTRPQWVKSATETYSVSAHVQDNTGYHPEQNSWTESGWIPQQQGIDAKVF